MLLLLLSLFLGPFALSVVFFKAASTTESYTLSLHDALPISTLGMALGPWAGGWLYDTFGGYFWLYMGAFGIGLGAVAIALTDRKSTRLNSSHLGISYAVFC